MTAKEFVKSKMPTATAERHTNRIMGFGENYYLIRERGEYMYFAEGTTESKAWKAAKEKIIKNENNEKVKTSIPHCPNKETDVNACEWDNKTCFLCSS